MSTHSQPNGIDVRSGTAHRWFLTAPHARRRIYGEDADPYELAHVRGPGDRHALCGLLTGNWRLFWNHPADPWHRTPGHAGFEICEECLARARSAAPSRGLGPTRPCLARPARVQPEGDVS